jgi:hypothetical protein
MVNPRRVMLAAALVILVLAPGGLLTAQQPADRFWPQWRGPFATGVSRTATPPVEWSETKNVRWKVPIPGRSSSTPVIWGDRIFLLTAVAVDPATMAGLAPRGSVPETLAGRCPATGSTLLGRRAGPARQFKAGRKPN